MSLGARALLWIRRAALLAASCASLGAAHSATGTNPAEALEMPTVEVVGTTPLPGVLSAGPRKNTRFFFILGARL